MVATAVALHVAPETDTLVQTAESLIHEAAAKNAFVATAVTLIHVAATYAFVARAVKLMSCSSNIFVGSNRCSTVPK